MKTFGRLCLGLVLLASRSPDRLLNPQFWAEDGSVFFCESVVYGGGAIGIAYRGYLHVVPRLAAALGSFLPWEWIPSAYAIVAAACTLYVVGRVFCARIPRTAAVVGSLAVLVVCHSGEIWSSLCCLHFIMGALLAVNLIESAPASRADSWRRGVEMALAILSGPEVIVAGPILLIRAWQFRREPVASVMMTLALASAAVQLGVMAAHPRVGDVDPAVMAATAIAAAFGYAEFLFAGAGADTFLNGPFPEFNFRLVVGAFAMIAVLVLLLDWRNRRRPTAWLLFAHAAALLVLARAAGADLFRLWPNPLANGGRYTYLPFVLATFGVGWLFAGILEQAPSRRRAVLLAAIPLMLVPLSAAIHWSPRPVRDYAWAEQVAEARAGRRKTFVSPANPGFDVPVRKTQLRRRPEAVKPH